MFLILLSSHSTKHNIITAEGTKYDPNGSDTYKWDIKKALEICNTTIEKYPDTFGAGECRWLQNQILQKSLSVQTEYGNLPDQPFRALVTYKNVNKIYLRVIPWTESLDQTKNKLDAQKLESTICITETNSGMVG